MFLAARRVAFARPFLLRAAQPGGPPRNTPGGKPPHNKSQAIVEDESTQDKDGGEEEHAQVVRRMLPKATDVLAENKRKLLGYQSLVHTRMLWEKSSLDSNKGAFNPNAAVRFKQEEQVQRDVPKKFADWEAPEQFKKDDKKIERSMEKSALNYRDAPIEGQKGQLWYSPEELMPDDGTIDPVEEDDELDATSDEEEDFAMEDDEDVLEANKAEMMMEKHSKKYYELLAKQKEQEKLGEADTEDKEGFEDEDLDALDAPPEGFVPRARTQAAIEQEYIDKLNIESVEREAAASEEIDEDDLPPEEDERETVMPVNDDDNRLRCLMCGIHGPKLHTMNVYLLSRYVSPHGDIYPRAVTGTCLRHQRDIGKVFRSAKKNGLLSFKDGGFRINIPFEGDFIKQYDSADRIDVQNNPEVLSTEKEIDAITQLDEDEDADAFGAVDEEDGAYDEPIGDLDHPIGGLLPSEESYPTPRRIRPTGPTKSSSPQFGNNPPRTPRTPTNTAPTRNTQPPRNFNNSRPQQQKQSQQPRRGGQQEWSRSSKPNNEARF